MDSIHYIVGARDEIANGKVGQGDSLRAVLEGWAYASVRAASQLDKFKHLFEFVFEAWALGAFTMGIQK